MGRIKASLQRLESEVNNKDILQIIKQGIFEDWDKNNRPDWQNKV